MLKPVKPPDVLVVPHCQRDELGDRNPAMIASPSPPKSPQVVTDLSTEPVGAAHQVRVQRLPDAPGAVHAEARAFCLAVIKEAYGFDYRADWHADLDSLCLPSLANHYAAENRGGFWAARDNTGALVATIGVKRLDWQPALSARLAPRYPRAGEIGAVSRAYVRADLRGQGLGARLTALCVEAARAMGYRTLYLHTNSDAEAAQRFWRSQGWLAFDTFGISTHFERHLAESTIP